MAVALSLLVILPALAENSIKTDGQLIKGETEANRVAVGVFSDPLDAQYDWQAFTSSSEALYNRDAKTNTGDDAAVRDPESPFMAGATAYLLDDIPLVTGVGGLDQASAIGTPSRSALHPADPRNTFYGGTLYVSNQDSAYNTVLITAQRRSSEAEEAFDSDSADPAILDADVYCVTATVTNERTNARMTVPLVNAAAGTLTGDYSKFQNFFEVVDDVNETEGRTALTCDKFAADTDGDGVADAQLAATDFPEPQRIAALSRDILTILVTGDTNVISIRVDGDGPEISSVAPAHGTIQALELLRISFTALDELSGLRHDAEQVLSEGPHYPNGDGDGVVSNLDDDNFESREPLSDPDGRSTDINVWYGTDSSEVTASNFADGSDGSASDISLNANDRWSAVEVGREYDFQLTYVAQPGTSDFADSATNVFWLVEARDRVGNITRLGAEGDDDATGETPYRITIDQEAPNLQDNTPETGITYKSDKEVTDRQYLAFQFAPDSTALDKIGDELDPDSIDIGDFYVEGFSILSYIHPTDDKGTDFDGGLFDPRSRVYVKLDRALGSGETPEVQLRHGAVRDLAGNPNVGTAPTEAIDRIGPLLTVTVNGAVQDRPVIMADDGELDIEVSSDESLRGRPEIWFAKIEYVPAVEDDPNMVGDQSKDAYYKVDADLKQGAALSRAVADEMAWSRTYGTVNLGIVDSDSGHYAVIVTAVDSATKSNPGYTDGWTWGGAHVGADRTAPKVEANDELDIDDLDDAGLIFEVDDALPEARVSVTPARVDDADETESRFPFIHIEFNGIENSNGDDIGEDAEYGITGLKDSHSRVVLRSLTVNGTDMLSAVLRVQGDDGQFSLALSQQELGDYEVKYEAVDDAGNTVKDDYTFSVVPRAPYEVGLVPGWNLISLPGTPLDQSIESVMVATSASAVLGYRQGNWESAIRTEAEDGTSSWQGSLTSMAGGYGYWVQTDGFESIETLIPEVDPASTLPTVPVAAGWNLLGVIDVRQAKAGDSPLEKSEADAYFTSIPWRVAYSFETILNDWTKLIPGVNAQVEDPNDVTKTIDDPKAKEIVNGKGYWTWSSEPGTLVP